MENTCFSIARLVRRTNGLHFNRHTHIDTSTRQNMCELAYSVSHPPKRRYLIWSGRHRAHVVWHNTIYPTSCNWNLIDLEMAAFVHVWSGCVCVNGIPNTEYITEQIESNSWYQYKYMHTMSAMLKMLSPISTKYLRDSCAFMVCRPFASTEIHSGRIWCCAAWVMYVEYCSVSAFSIQSHKSNKALNVIDIAGVFGVRWMWWHYEGFKYYAFSLGQRPHALCARVCWCVSLTMCTIE